MKNLDYEAVVRLVKNRASLGKEFTSVDLYEDWLDRTGDLETKTVKRIQKALSTASSNKEIVKVRSVQNPNRKSGNMFVWRGTLNTDEGVCCPTCKQKLQIIKKQKPKGYESLGKWV